MFFQQVPYHLYNQKVEQIQTLQTLLEGAKKDSKVSDDQQMKFRFLQI